MREKWETWNRGGTLLKLHPEASSLSLHSVCDYRAVFPLYPLNIILHQHPTTHSNELKWTAVHSFYTVRMSNLSSDRTSVIHKVMTKTSMTRNPSKDLIVWTDNKEMVQQAKLSSSSQYQCSWPTGSENEHPPSDSKGLFTQLRGYSPPPVTSVTGTAAVGPRSGFRFCPTAESSPCWTLGSSRWAAANQIEEVRQSGPPVFSKWVLANLSTSPSIF